jgi:hypothetical protein
MMCSVDGCSRPALARGWCSGHYARWRRTGDVQAVVPLRVLGGDVLERFWSKVDVGEEDDCWEWTGYRYRKYGRFNFESVSRLAHRVAWILLHGPLPDEQKVLHSCDNPPCCNPLHLFVGTQTDNMQDMIAKGRAHFQKGQDVAV